MEESDGKESKLIYLGHALVETRNGLIATATVSVLTWASRSAFYYFLLLLTVFHVVSDWKPLATAGMKCQGKLNVLKYL